MKKISFASYITSVVVSVICGSILATGVIYLVAPNQVKASVLPVIDYENIAFANGKIIAGSSPFGLPAMSVAPVAPTVPDMPTSPVNVLEVVGVLPPDVVVLQRGSETVTAYLGDETKFGTVQEIFDNGALVDGKFVNLRLKVDNYTNYEGEKDEDDE